MIRSPESLTIALLTNRLIESDAKALTAREFWQMFPHDQLLSGIIEMDISQLASHLNLKEDDARRIRTLLDASRALAFESERLEESGISMVTAADEAFPAKLRASLGEQCPAMLLVAGPSEWLSEPGVGIVGSRKITESHEEVAADVARSAVRGGFGVISGLARGIDQVAMRTGLEIGGRVCGIPTEGIRTISRNSDIRAAVQEGALTIASPYGPDAPFSVGSAMGRNKLIYGLADATVIITSDSGKGGTWEGALEAMKKNYGRVLVWDGADVSAGNAALIAKGAESLTDLSDNRWLAPQDTADFHAPPSRVEPQRLF
jgi:predicted Rossmann fold nucleotide-binding protein DprA/Smf involved in DNA uptake